jgi:hypothetical protein
VSGERHTGTTGSQKGFALVAIVNEPGSLPMPISYFSTKSQAESSAVEERRMLEPRFAVHVCPARLEFDVSGLPVTEAEK